jgi:hypothetical protein
VLFEHLQARPTIELALDRFESVDLPFDDPLTIAVLERPGDSCNVSPDALDEANQIRNARLLGLLEPLLEGGTIAVPHHRHKSRQVVLHGKQIWAAPIQLRQNRLLLHSEL